MRQNDSILRTNPPNNSSPESVSPSVCRNMFIDRSAVVSRCGRKEVGKCLRKGTEERASEHCLQRRRRPIYRSAEISKARRANGERSWSRTAATTVSHGFKSCQPKCLSEKVQAKFMILSHYSEYRRIRLQ